MNQSDKHLYEFGPFRLDPAERLLLRDGQHVPLTPKAFETLLILVENCGHVLNKDELLKKVWPDTFVEEVNLAKNVSYLRKILGGEQAAQYIETIPKRGYRFVASVKDICDERAELMWASPAAARANDHEEVERGDFNSGSEPRKSQIESERNGLPARPRARRRGWLALWPALGLLLGVGIWALVFRPSSESPTPLLNIVPFTSFPGRETQAAFSPDGNQIAFVWDGGKGDNPDIYIKLIGAGHPLRLTTHPGSESHPVWSPDGRYIAFFRQTTESSGYYLIPA
jgi:DNA-binding winged helix-turn-helix (wHTH) protein